MEKSVIKYLSEFSFRTEERYGDVIALRQLFEDAESGKLNIADDLSWLTDFSAALDSIQRILGNEHLHVKYVKQLTKVQTASRIDSEGFALTMKEPRLWKWSDKGIRPEKVYMTLYEDEYAIYENRFIKMLIDEIIRYLSETLTELADSLGNLRAYFGSRLTAAGALRMSDETASDTDDKRVLADGEDPIIEAYDRAEALLKKAKKFKNSTLYRECMGKPVLSGNIQPTNILTKDDNYRQCYLFYKRFSLMRGHGQNIAHALFDNGMLRLLYGMHRVGYRLTHSAMLTKHLTGERTCKNIVMQKDNFSIEMDACGENEFLLKTTMLQKETVAGEDHEKMLRYKSKTVLKFSDCTADESGALAAAYRKQKLAEGYDDAFLAVYSRRPTDADGVVNFANKGDFGCRAAEDFVRALTMQLAGAHKVFSKRCPVCGTKCAGGDDDTVVCIGCQSAWSLVLDGETEKVWLKRIRH